MKTEHTPVPWFAARENDCDGIDDQTIVAFDTFRDGSKHPRAIAITCRPNANLAAANRDFIIRAVNNHERLVKALNAMLCCHDYGKSTTFTEWESAVEQARAILKELNE